MIVCFIRLTIKPIISKIVIIIMDKMDNPPQPGFNTSMPYPYPQPPPPPPQQPSFGTESQHVVCPHCHANISTRVETEATMKTHLMALLLCLFVCPCAPCPYCIDSCQAKKHYCPACGSYLGSSDN
ncbi:lipopolysaccharide-induced tumor necrosis factor-alpha factor homolog isoform X2 [Polyergus mexicanus]|uniref:lipopolysaccharide-induced tumor necrosis factor-alpha factor homolog isoform X2 n=1 Tax=Polyergus mexicanus TaxID=615972 RepID=UPI0038B47E0A